MDYTRVCEVMFNPYLVQPHAHRQRSIDDISRRRHICPPVPADLCLQPQLATDSSRCVLPSVTYVDIYIYASKIQRLQESKARRTGARCPLLKRTARF